MSDLPAGMLAGCERFVRADVQPGERERQTRLICVLLAAPFLAGPVLALSLGGGGSALALSLLCATVAISWALALGVALTGAHRAVERVALSLGVLAIAAASVAGGLPVLLLAAGLAFEAWWVGRGARAAVAGIAAAIACFPAAQAATLLIDAPAVGGAAWLWLAPAALGVAAGVRLSPVRGGAAEQTAVSDFDPVVDRLRLAVIRLAPSGEIVSVSEQAASALGLARDALIGRTLLERVHITDRVALLTALDRGAAEDAAHRIALRLRVAMAGRPGDRFHPFSAEIVRDEAGALISLREDDSADIHERLARAEERAEILDIAKGRFLAAVSHELRTPLNSIIGFSDMLLHGMAGPLEEGRQAEYVGLIRDSGSHLLSVVNAILDVSKIESGAYSIEAEPFAVREAVDLCHAMLTPQAEAKGINFLVRARADAGTVVADRRAVQQILINLAANAIKFTPAGGKVSVEAMRSGGWLRLVVSDTGIGMSEEDLGRIGQPFMQVQNDLTRQFEGTGLGLSLVKGLVRLHEGEMTIESAPGEGTLVTVALPVAGPRASRQQDGIKEANGGAHEAFRKIA